MRDDRLFFMDLNGGSSNMFPMDPLVPHRFGGQFLSHITSFVDNSRYLYVPGSLALQEVFNCVSKFAGGLIFWFASGSNSNINRNLSGNSHASNPSNSIPSCQLKQVAVSGHNVMGFFSNSRNKGKCPIPVIFGKLSRLMLKRLCKEAERLQSLSPLSLAAALVPPLNNVSSDLLAVPLETGVLLSQRCMDERPCEVQGHSRRNFALENFSWTRHAVEPKTGIEFPAILDDIGAVDKFSNLSPEVLVGTGSKIMKIVKVKSLKVYAFGFYIHPLDICKKLGPKYASIPVGDVSKCSDFYDDLLREDINMTVRLVVSCNGIKINTVRDAFEKSLRARLVKANPETDYNCLKTFGSFFSEDIPLQVGTTIDFRRTADGHFITEIGGNQVGAVHSKDLCRAFFDMYIGDFPVSEQAKDEIGKNLVSIMRRC